MWQGIEGHDDVVEQFRRALAAGRLATTYLFVGTEGVGKRTFALKLAQTLLCTERDPAEMNPCGQCESCRLAFAGNHPDLDVVGLKPGKRELLIEQFIGDLDHRNEEGLCHNIALKPMIGRRRVAIIDDADWFRTESANCLLKVLEEPPPGAVIILVGTSRSRLLPTILSRSQVVRFNALPDEVVRDLALSEGIAPDEKAAAELASRSGGSFTAARELADDALWEMRDRLIAQWNAGEIDATRTGRDFEEFINAAGKEAEQRRQRFRQLLHLVAEAMSLKVRAGAADGRIDERTLEAIDRTLQASEQIDRNANQATLLETWLDDLATLLSANCEAAAR